MLYTQTHAPPWYPISTPTPPPQHPPGKHSGRHALTTRLQQLGVELGDEQLNDVFKRFKNLADKKKDGVQDEDLLALVSDEMQSTSAIWELLDLQVCVCVVRALLCSVGKCAVGKSTTHHFIPIHPHPSPPP